MLKGGNRDVTRRVRAAAVGMQRRSAFGDVGAPREVVASPQQAPATGQRRREVEQHLPCGPT
jgi:hypothetical protein